MKRAVFLVLLGLIASACRIDVDLRVDLNRDGSGNLDLTVTTDQEFERNFGLTGDVFEEFMVQRGGDIGLPFAVIDGAEKQYIATAEGLSAESIDRVLERLVPNLGTVDITADEETFVFTGDLQPLPDADILRPFFDQFDAALLAESADITVTLTVPGEVDVSSASQVEGNQLTYEIPFDNQPVRIFARTRLASENGGSFPWALTILLLVGAGALAFLIAIRSQAGQTATSTSDGMSSVPYAPEHQPVAPPIQHQAPPPPMEKEPVPPDEGLPWDDARPEAEVSTHADDPGGVPPTP